MVNEKPLTDFGPGMNLDARTKSCHMRSQAAKKAHFMSPEKMSDAITPKRM
jgi:hypothetical protein